MNTELLARVCRLKADTHNEYICPACGGVAEVEWRDWSGRSSGPVEHVKIRCTKSPLVPDAGRKPERSTRALVVVDDRLASSRATH